MAYLIPSTLVSTEFIVVKGHQHFAKILLLAFMPKILALVGCEFPSHNSLHPHPTQPDVLCGIQRCAYVSIPRPLQCSLSHHSRPVTQLERTEKEVSCFWNSPLGLSGDYPYILARKLKSGKIISTLQCLVVFLVHTSYQHLCSRVPVG